MGNTPQYLTTSDGVKDHPHVYGEYLAIVKVKGSATGSPPRIWGILVDLLVNSVTSRITPTYMGNTFERPIQLRHPWDHPHVYGEYTKRLPANQAFAPSIPQFSFSLLI